MKLIQLVDLNKVIKANFQNYFVSCIILTIDNKILLQQRGENWPSFPGFISTFGGKIELGETPIHALIRELKEELGAQVKESEIIALGAYTEAITNHTELVYGYFWPDEEGTITGCYEGVAKYIENIKSIETISKLMDDVPYLLSECKKRKLFNL